MSTYVEEKLKAPERTANEKARARLYQLNARWGSEELNPKKPPELVMVRAPSCTEFWKRVGPLEGKDTLYELRGTETREAEG